MRTTTLIFTMLLAFYVQRSKAQKTRTLYDSDILYGKVTCVSEIQYLPGNKADPAMKDTTWYDENGLTMSRSSKPRFGPLIKFKYINTETLSGRKIEIITSQGDQEIKASVNADGQLVSYDSYSKTGGITSHSIYIQ